MLAHDPHDGGDTPAGVTRPNTPAHQDRAEFGQRMPRTEDRAVVEKILTHLGLPADLTRPSAARTPEWLPGVRDGADHADPAGAHWAD